MSMKTAYISIDSKLCKACFECVDACPNSVLGKVNMPFHKHAKVTKADSCSGCGTCAAICPGGAISLIKG